MLDGLAKAPLVRVLGTLWRMLSGAKKVHFVVLNLLLVVSGLLEMGGMLFIFGFIGGLSVDPETGERGGRLGSLFDLFHVGPMSNREYVVFAGGLVLAVLAIKNLLSTLVQFGLNRFLMKLNQRVSERLFAGVLVAPFEQVKFLGATGLSRNILKIFEVFSRSFAALAQVLADGFMVSMVFLLLLFINPQLTLAATLMFLLIGAVTYQWMQKTLVHMGRLEAQGKRRARAYLEDGVHGLVDVRLRDARNYVSRGYARALQSTALQKRRKAALERLPRAINEMSLAFMIVGAVFFLTHTGGSLASALPTLGIFGFAGLRMTGALTRINKAFQRLRRNHEEFEFFYEAIATMAPETFGQGKRSAEYDYLHAETSFKKGESSRFRKELVARGVTFSYGEEKPILEGIDLEIARGSFVSFCGPSGGGKTTLVLLLMGLLPPKEGQITCDGWNILEHLRSWHENIGYVGQDAYLASRSIRENVAFGVDRKDIDDEMVWRALRLASAEQFVRGLPKRLGYRLQEGGSNLSGGQRQRLIIARALYRDPEVLILDEATAALDNKTERSITEAVAELTGMKTIICVAHRLSTIRGSDKIFLLEEGKIQAAGTYQELLESSPSFRELADIALEGTELRVQSSSA